MAKEAMVANLQLELDQKTGLGVYLGNLMRANREHSLIDKVSACKEGEGLVVLGNLSELHPLDLMDGIFAAELKGYQASGKVGQDTGLKSAIVFDTIDALQDDDSGIDVTTNPILEISFPQK
jgi:hypothetical protein